MALWTENVWCPRCGQETIALRTRRCQWCDTRTVTIERADGEGAAVAQIAAAGDPSTEAAMPSTGFVSAVAAAPPHPLAPGERAYARLRGKGHLSIRTAERLTAACMKGLADAPAGYLLPVEAERELLQFERELRAAA